ncbi:hypothetical protein F4678DRAFT_417401 [Xylaria arbuscula]|nr:hypothetical protein F4678DRAFT_417401 [Xylaria arbuscula]
MGVEENPFVRFKNHIDGNIARGWDLLSGSLAAPPVSSPSSESPSATSTSTSATRATTTGITPPSTISSSSSSSSSPSSPALKMSNASSSRASNAATSDQQHTSSPTTPTSPTATATSTTSTPTPEDPTAPPTSPTTISEVHTWSTTSPYSPLNLHHLRQPTPQDTPRVCEGRFTFADAFEDLLVTGSGEPLPPPHSLVWKKCWPSYNERSFHRNTRSDADAWVTRLGGLGLWDAYFTVEAGDGKKAYRDDWERRDRGRTGPGSFTSVSFPGGRVGVEGWRDEGRGHFGAKGVWDGAWRVRGESRWGEGDADSKSPENDTRDGEEDRDADVEDELYRASRKDASGRELSVVIDRHGGLHRPSTSTSTSSSTAVSTSTSTPETTTTVYADGNKFVRTTERRERDGKTEITTTEHHYDAQGNLLSESRGVSKSRTWSGSLGTPPGASAGASFSWSWNNNSGSATSRDGEDGENANERKEKSGWFWQR